MLVCGLDWSDQALEYHLRGADGADLAHGSVPPTVQGLADLFAALECHGRPSEIGVAVETTHAAWIQALLDRGYRVYPVNPKCADAFRKALSANGEKTDGIDARLLARFLATVQDRLRPLRPDAAEIVALRTACQDRMRLVQEQTAKLNELGAILKAHYPAFLGLFGGHDSVIALTFLLDYPTQAAMQGLTAKRLLKWLQRHRYPCRHRLEMMAAHLGEPALPVAAHLQEAKAPLIRYLAQALIALRAVIAQRDREITDQFNALPESQWAGSLPGAARVLGPGVLACFGRDQERFATAAEACAFMGTAPVTKQSGRQVAHVFRHGCWKFARQTLQQLAEHSRARCAWAADLYQRQRASGHGHNAALRAVAHKWVKIIWAMQRSGQPYDEHRFRPRLPPAPFNATTVDNLLLQTPN